MKRDEFIGILATEGFDVIVTVEQPAGQFLAAHAHPFEAKALILDGELCLGIGDTEHVYKPGQVFHLRANEVHAEHYGPAGVTYLVGRK